MVLESVINLISELGKRQLLFNCCHISTRFPNITMDLTFAIIYLQLVYG